MECFGEYNIPEIHLCVLNLGGKAGNIFAQFDVLAFSFI